MTRKSWFIFIYWGRILNGSLPLERLLNSPSFESQLGGNHPGSHWHSVLWLHTWGTQRRRCHHLYVEEYAFKYVVLLRLGSRRTHSVAFASCWTIGSSVGCLKFHTLILTAYLGKKNRDWHWLTSSWNWRKLKQVEENVHSIKSTVSPLTLKKVLRGYVTFPSPHLVPESTWPLSLL